MSDRLTFLFMPESAYGPTNNCIGIGHRLLEKGHRVVFAAESSWAGKLTALGFEEDLVDLAPPPDDDAGDADAGAFWKEYIRSVAPEFRTSTSEQLETVTLPIWEELVSGAKYCEPQLKEIIARTAPDVIVEDNVLTFPALVTAGVPFVRLVSCNPLEVPGDEIAPVFSGLAESDAHEWDAFRAEYDRTHRALWEEFNEWVQEQGAPPLPELEFIHAGAMNLYVYPEELDYIDKRPLDETWHRLESSVRDTESDIELPAEMTGGDEPLIYFSLGSLGSADTALMRSVIAALERGPWKVIVSKGPLHEEIDLPDGMWGAEFLPQTTLLPRADLVITHGGNNTTTEAMHFGKPMILLPLFWDQYDNAARVAEKGYGVRLDTYRFRPEELTAAIDQLLHDPSRRERSRTAGERIRALDGVQKAADLLEDLGRRHAGATA